MSHAIAPMPVLLPPVAPPRSAVATQSVPNSLEAASLPSVAAEVPSCQTVTAEVTDGLAGVLKVMTLLHGRRYRVGSLSVDVREEVASTVGCTVVLTAGDLGLLLARLRRLPAVVSAAKA